MLLAVGKMARLAKVVPEAKEFHTAPSMAAHR
jgi:hypothetical protein